jgi:hypothetical protein
MSSRYPGPVPEIALYFPGSRPFVSPVTLVVLLSIPVMPKPGVFWGIDSIGQGMMVKILDTLQDNRYIVLALPGCPSMPGS